MKTITGDLLQIDRGLILHQVNCMGATGGLAGALRRKWPLAFWPYLNAVRLWGSKNPLGSTVMGECTYDLYIAHVFGQKQPGANTDLAAVDSALADLAAKIQTRPELTALPLFAPFLMGCGLGGGRWEAYLPLLEKHLPALTLVKLPSGEMPAGAKLEKQDQ